MTQPRVSRGRRNEHANTYLNALDISIGIVVPCLNDSFSVMITQPALINRGDRIERANTLILIGVQLCLLCLPTDLSFFFRLLAVGLMDRGG